MTNPDSTTIRIGTAGWSYEDWKGVVYPEAAPRAWHPLTLLCRLFDLVEINVSFYRPIHPAHCKTWLEKVSGNPRFLFTAKLWERFTHHRESWPEPHEIKACLEGMIPLLEAGKLGAVLAQFPHSFHRTPENRAWLLRTSDMLSGFPLALEVRHNSWDCPEFYDGLKERDIAFCSIDQPIFITSMPPVERCTGTLGYIRLHGRNREHWFKDGAGRNARYDYLYSEEELVPWINRAQNMKQLVKNLFVVTNNHYRGQAVVNALEIQAALLNKPVEIPRSLQLAYPRLDQKPDTGQ